MVDIETEKEWEKSRQIEAERMKAAKALAEEDTDKSNLAYLDPKTTKVKGWSNDYDVIMASAERMGNRSILFAIGGVVLDIVGTAGSLVGSFNQLGMATVVISGIPSGVGIALLGLAILISLVTIGCEVVLRIKNKRKFTSAMKSAVAAIVIVTVYFVVKQLIMNYH